MADQTPPVRERDPRQESAAAPKRATEFKLAERREDGKAVLEMEDGRMFVADVKDGLDGLRKGGTVVISAASYTEDGVPEGANVIRAA